MKQPSNLDKKKTVFKVQRSLAGNTGDNVLIYDKERSFMQELPFTDVPIGIQAVLKYQPKVYVVGKKTDNDIHLEIERLIEEQPW